MAPNSSAFAPPLPLSKSSRASSSRVSRKTEPTAQITSVSDRQLTDLLSSQSSNSSVVVLKCYATYCRGCKGVEPKYRKIAAAYEKAEHDDHHRAMVHFVEMDYQRYERFCKDKLGVSSLPFFGIWKDGKYVGGEAMGWQSVGKKLVRNIESVITARPVESPV